MKKILALSLLILILIACTADRRKPEPKAWDRPIYIINEKNVSRYTLRELSKMSSSTMMIPDLSAGKTVTWRGVKPQNLGTGDVITFIARNGEIVSIPYNVSMLLALYSDGKPLSADRLIVNLSYTCRCSWISDVKIIEFVRKRSAIAITGEVSNQLWMTWRSVKVVMGAEAVLNNNSKPILLKDLIKLAQPWTLARKVFFLCSNGTVEVPLSEVMNSNAELVFVNGNFAVPALNVYELRKIRIEGGGG